MNPFSISFEATKWPFSITLLLMNLSVAIEKIPYSMGRTAIVFWMGCIASWGGTSVLFSCLNVVLYVLVVPANVHCRSPLLVLLYSTSAGGSISDYVLA